jgi:tetratricopeptide (TPR) repeat protein
MFLAKNSLTTAITVLLLAATACVQTSEHTSGEFITIDPRLSYGQGLQKTVARARKALQENPNDPAPHYTLGQAYLLQNNLTAAEAEFRIILKLSPSSAGAYYELARINATRGKHEAAIEEFNQAVKLNPHFPEAQYALARLYEKLGKPEKAAIHDKAYFEALKHIDRNGATISP